MSSWKSTLREKGTDYSFKNLDKYFEMCYTVLNTNASKKKVYTG